jgi:hypothetical protein
LAVVDVIAELDILMLHAGKNKLNFLLPESVRLLEAFKAWTIRLVMEYST